MKNERTCFEMHTARGGGGVGHQGVKKNSLHPVKYCLMRMEAGNNSGSVITRIVPLN